ncbi:MAG: membrane protein insertion efficiency factor YidD [Planctomycetota bacterium]
MSRSEGRSRAFFFVPIVAMLASCSGSQEADDSQSGVAANAGTGAIEFYQDHLGDQWGFHCDFEPSCSEYGRQAVSKYGFLPGTLLIADRLMRDHPYSRHLYDRTSEGHPIDRVEDNTFFVAQVPASLPADGDPELDAPEQQIRTGHEVFHFAEHLFQDGEWDRARIEYRRYLFLLQRAGPKEKAAMTGDDTSREREDRCRERIALCLLRLGRLEDALIVVTQLTSSLRASALRATILEASGRVDGAIDALPDSRAGRTLAGLYALEHGRTDEARESFGSLGGELQDNLLDHCDRFDELPYRSPLAGGFLSAVLPGSGQVYSGRFGDAFAAFAMNGLLISGTVLAALNDEEVTAAVVGTVAFGFYAGNVYGGANAARRFNYEHRQDYMRRVRGELRQHRVKFGLSPNDAGGVFSIYFDF